MDNALVTTQLAVQGMVDLCDDYAFEPTVQTANAVLIRKTVAANACIQTVEKAFEVVGGGAFFRSVGLERLLRDIHGVQFHPLQEKRQHPLQRPRGPGPGPGRLEARHAPRRGNRSMPASVSRRTGRLKPAPASTATPNRGSVSPHRGRR
jgi:Acyl-CoA dehydrogenase, C-terminal domain